MASLPGASDGLEHLLDRLKEDLETSKLSSKEQCDLLAKVKVYGRDPRTAGPIFKPQSIITLCRYGLDKESGPTSHEALRCLANALLLNEPSRQIVVDQGYAAKAAERLKSDNFDDEFLACRILFLLTYNTNVDFNTIATEHQLADSLNKRIAQHSTAFSDSGHNKPQSSPMEDMALTEALKLIFNLTAHYPDLTPTFTPSIAPLTTILLRHPLPSPPLQPPISALINALLNLDLASTTDHLPLTTHLTTILSLTLQAHPTPSPDLDTSASPLLTLLRRLHTLAPASSPTQNHLRSTLLPSAADRSQPLGKGSNLAARLLQLTSAAHLPTLRENATALLFELSGSDADAFVRNVGYGHAAGFLASHNMSVPRSASGAGAGAEDVNPVTGQRWDAEEAGRGAEMTEEEKEREAERLFVLFERLRATGVVDVENPVRRARDEGRFEEVE